MTHTEYRAAIAALGLSQLGAGRFLGVSPRRAQSWALGERPVPVSIAMLLQIMVDFKISPFALAQMPSPGAATPP